MLPIRTDPGETISNNFDNDPCRDPSLPDIQSDSDEGIIKEDIKALLHQTRSNGLTDEYWDHLHDMVWESDSLSHILFSSKLDRVEPLVIAFTSDARPIRVKLRSYSAEQRSFMMYIVSELLHHKLVYPNPSAQ